MSMKIRGAFLIALLIGTSGVCLQQGLAQSAAEAERALQKAIRTETVDGDLQAALAQYKKIIGIRGVDRAVAAKAMFQMGQCYEKLGQAGARKIYERILKEYSDQGTLVARARARIAALQPARPATIAMRSLWEGPDADLFGGVSSDGGFVTFKDRGNDLAVVDLATGQKRLLTKHTRWEFAMGSVPSPDGKQVAYTWYNNDHSYDLRVVAVDGSEPRVLYRDPELTWLHPTDWSPDGKQILLTIIRKDKSNDVVAVSAADGSTRVLKTFGFRAPSRPRFSPDGRFIAYALPQRPDSRQQDIFVMAADGSHEIPLIEHAANDVLPDWTPDGNRILFGSDRTGTMGVWSVAVSDGKPAGMPELVKPDFGQDVSPMGFTRDGTYYYGVRSRRTDVYIAEMDFQTGRALRPPLPATERYVGYNSRPDWSPDGRQLIFLSRRGPGTWAPRAFCVRSTETGEIRELASKLDRVSWVRWSPDGRWLLAAAQTDGFGIFRIDVQTGNFSPVVQNKTLLGWPAVWSGDGKSVYYFLLSKPRVSLMAHDIETGQETELHSVTQPSNYQGGALSPDGKELAVLTADLGSGTKVLLVLPIGGGAPREVLRGAPLQGFTIAWTADGRNLLFASRTNPTVLQTDLWLVPAAGGQPRKLDLSADDLSDLSVHRDGRRIAYTSGRDKTEVWALENLLSRRGTNR